MHVDTVRSDADAHPVFRGLHRVEDMVLFVVFMATMALPLIEAIGRPFDGFHIPGSAAYLQHMVLWLTFLGGLIATRERKHLRLSTTEAIPEGKPRAWIMAVAMGVAASIAMVLAYAAWQVVQVNRESPTELPIGLPAWVSEAVMPGALVLTAARFAWNAGDGFTGENARLRWAGRAVAFLIIPLGFLLDYTPDLLYDHFWWLVALVIAAALLGAPVFVAMAGIGMILFAAEDTPISTVSVEIYGLVSSPTLPAIPLLTACGYVLAETEAAGRLVRFFKALFGWMPGGVAVLVACVCAVFTTFTGGSGVTIIALGGLAYGILKEDKYSDGFSLGLVTASGSLGLLFPPSLPVILYAVVASVPADQLYIAGILPGLLLLVLVAGYGVWVGRKNESARPPFDWGELGRAFWAAKWELSVPLIVVVLFGSGVASMVEAAAFACAYAIIVECFVTRDIHPIKELPGVMVKAGVLVGAVLILLSSAMGMSAYLVDAFIPDLILEWTQERIESKIMFLLALNGILLVLGSVLEIYSAIVILPPIVAPLAAHYGIDPVHMGIIFLANLELGYLFPPVGLNLFLSSTRFDRPMVELYKYVVPYLLILGFGVLVITYVPSISIGVLSWFGSG